MVIEKVVQCTLLTVSRCSGELAAVEKQPQEGLLLVLAGKLAVVLGQVITVLTVSAFHV